MLPLSSSLERPCCPIFLVCRLTASIARATSCTFFNVRSSLPSSFLLKADDRHLSMTWSLMSVSRSVKLQFCTCFRSLSILLNIFLNTSLDVRLVKFSCKIGIQSAHCIVFSNSVAVSLSTPAPWRGAVNVSYNTWTSIPAEWISKAFTRVFCASFTTPLATKKYWNDWSRSFEFQSGVKADELPLQSNGATP